MLSHCYMYLLEPEQLKFKPYIKCVVGAVSLWTLGPSILLYQGKGYPKGHTNHMPSKSMASFSVSYHLFQLFFSSNCY